MASWNMSESPLDKTDQMLRNMHPTWWRVFGQEQDLEKSGFDAGKPWWEVWENDETAAEPNADAAVEKEGDCGEAVQQTGGTSSDPIPPPPTPPPATFFSKNRRADGRTRTHKKPIYPSEHALTRARKIAALQKTVSRRN